MEKLDLLSRVRSATDSQLFDGLEGLTLTEHAYLVKIVVILGEIDRRGIYREKAWPSLFEYCVAHLKYSDGQTYRRIQAARAIQSFPALLTIFEARQITLTNLARINQHLTEANHLSWRRKSGPSERMRSNESLPSGFQSLT